MGQQLGRIGRGSVHGARVPGVPGHTGPVPLPSWLRRLLRVPVPAPRISGPPPSPNGASSFHLAWQVPGELSEVSATLEVLDPPVVDALYFWALQVSFVEGGRRTGAAHLGLQHNPRFPGSGAVNWGGYSADGSLLDGSSSPLPSTPADPNTRDFAWRAGVRYRLRIFRSVERGWRATVRDLERGDEVVVRDLEGKGELLAAPLVWSEVFADCDAPSVAVRWSDLAALDQRGNEVRPSALEVNYQGHAAGGCANTSSELDPLGVVQRTSTTRRVAQGALLGPV